MIERSYVESLVGKQIYAITRDGRMIEGIVDRVDHNMVYLRRDNKTVKTSAFFPFNPITPLVLFDLLAIGTSPFAFGGFPFFI